MLTVDDAMDIIDIYGPHRKRWPPVDANDMDALLSSNDELAAYLKRQQKIDAMLNNWQEDLDGADIETDEDPSDHSHSGDDEEDEDDDSPDEEDNDEDSEQQDQPEVGCVDEEDDGARPSIILNPDAIEDMDDKFAATIKGLIDESAGSQFNVFSRDLDGFEEVKVPDDTTTEAIDQAVMKAVGPLMKDLRRLIAARSQARRIPGKRSGRLHAPSLHRIKLGDDRVFSRKEETPSLNTAITLLVDASGSMASGRLRLAMETSYALGTVLNKLGIAFECIGFTDGWPGGHQWPMKTDQQQWYDEAMKAGQEHPIGRIFPLIVARWKAFEDRWTIPTMKRFAATHKNNNAVQMGSTPEGCGLEFAAKRLLARSEDRKILICMTDGSPGCTDYNASGEPGKSDFNHSKDMVAAIAAAGVDIVGIGINHNGPTGYYPNSLVIQNVGEMPKLLMGVLKRFILG
jgi:cobalamin biosynthesis protein CobT